MCFMCPPSTGQARPFNITGIPMAQTDCPTRLPPQVTPAFSTFKKLKALRGKQVGKAGGAAAAPESEPELEPGPEPGPEPEPEP